MFGFGGYPRKPLTPEQVAENEDHDRRVAAANSAMYAAIEAARAKIKATYGLDIEDDADGGWYVADMTPHVAEYDLDAFTPEQKRRWERDQEFNRIIRDSMIAVIEDHRADMNRFFADGAAFSGRTVEWRRHAGEEK